MQSLTVPRAAPGGLLGADLMQHVWGAPEMRPLYEAHEPLRSTASGAARGLEVLMVQSRDTSDTHHRICCTAFSHLLRMLERLHKRN